MKKKYWFVLEAKAFGCDCHGIDIRAYPTLAAAQKTYSGHMIWHTTVTELVKAVQLAPNRHTTNVYAGFLSRTNIFKKQFDKHYQKAIREHQYAHNRIRR